MFCFKRRTREYENLPLFFFSFWTSFIFCIFLFFYCFFDLILSGYIHILLLISLEDHLLDLHLVEYVISLHGLRKRHDLISHEAIDWLALISQ